jgi:hypothetical protein
MSHSSIVVTGILVALAAGAAALPAASQEPAAEPPAPASEAAAPAAPAAPAPALHYANKWRLQVSEGANNDGDMLFRLTPKDGAPTDVRVHLKKGRGEDGCARDIRDAFKAALDRKSYKVEVDDGEDVLVKKLKGPDFSVELVESTVKGTRVSFDRE